MPEIETVNDAKGRAIQLRELNVIQQYRIARALGPVDAGNERMVSLAESACMVVQIDDHPRPAPTNGRQIEAAIEVLGDDGMAAVMVWRMGKVRAAMASAEAAMEAGQGPLAPSAPSPSSPPSASA